MKTALVLMSLAGFPYQFSSIVKHSVANSSRNFTPRWHEHLRDPGQPLSDTILGHIKRNWTQGHLCGRVKTVVVWATRGILATTIQLCSFLRHQGMRNFLRNLWQRSISGTANKSFFINFVCIYITVRRILYQMGGIFSASVLYREIQHLIILIITIMTWLHTKRYWCNEFRMNSSGDFLLTREKKNSLGCVYVYATRGGVMKTGNSNPGFNKFSYEGGGSNQRKPGLKNSL